MSAPSRFQNAMHWTSIGLVLLATLSSAMLVLQQLAGLRLPGCGPSSGCAQLSASRWGAVFGWPVSYLGLAYFLAVLAALLASHSGRLTLGMRRFIGLGGLASLLFLSVMAVEQTWCAYCLAVHLCNLGLVAIVWSMPPSPESPTLTRWRIPLITAVAVSAALALAMTIVARISQEEQLAQTEESIEQILANEKNASATTSNGDAIAAGGFKGRRPRGADPARARLVVFHDYQCKDCAKLDAELEELITRYPDLNVASRHYPMCTKCNPHMSWDFFHTEACHAAYLTEAAASVGGVDGYWKMHEWLFGNLGKFTSEDLQEFCRVNGWDSAELEEAAQDESVKHVVEEDIAEAHALGATGTPFVFLNGVEIRGASSNPGNVRLAVERLLESSPTPRAIGWDRRPPAAADRLLAEWSFAEPVNLPPASATRMVFGSPESTNRVLVFLEPTDREALPLWRNIRHLIDDRADVRIELYLFPISRSLNPKFASSSKEMYPHSAEVTRLIEGLHLTVARDTLPAAITWCLETSQVTGEELYKQAATKFGMKYDSLAEAMKDDRVEAGIKSDLQQAEIAKVSWAPTVIIQARRAPSATVPYDLITRFLNEKLASP